MPLSPVSSTVDAGLSPIFFSRLRIHHVPALADDALQAEGLRLLGAQRAHFAAQVRSLQPFLDDLHHLIEIERLVGVVKRPLLHRLDDRFDAGVGRQHDHHGVGIGFLDLLQHAQPVTVGQGVIEQHEIGAFAMTLHGFTAGCGLERAIALLAQAIGERPPD